MRRVAYFVADGVMNNAVFDPDHSSNRDNCNRPFRLLKDALAKNGIELKTPDFGDISLPLFSICIDNPRDYKVDSDCYILLFETPHVRSLNSQKDVISKAKRVFTWNDELVNGVKYIKFNFPNNITIPEVGGFLGRDRFCCVIAGNKTLPRYFENDLYIERVKSIRWFEKNAAEYFDLYGPDWDLPSWGRGWLGNFSRKIFRLASPYISLGPFPSYRGKIKNKCEILNHTRYAICYENVRDVSGYITEKIFDCFIAGCVPVYWGASNVTDYIPADCFIDRRRFRDTEAVFKHLKSISEEDFSEYQQRITEFLASEAAYQFCSEFFADTVAGTILKDIGVGA